MAVNILDCTLRDGGYYNNWDFSLDLIQRYLDAIGDAAISHCELGFRGLRAPGFGSVCAHTPDWVLEQLSVPDHLKICVMVNVSDLLVTENPISILLQLFKPKQECKVDIVRLAFHSAQVDAAIEAGNWLKESGYEVGLNLMQVACISEMELGHVAQKVSEHCEPLAFYIADSTGSLVPEQVAQIIKALTSIVDVPIGVHMHDNLGLAIQNSLAAVAAGASFVDSTITGMGRGPGNAQTELVICESDLIRPEEVDPSGLLALIDDYFNPLKAKCSWGTNYFYWMAGKKKIHPTYIQRALSGPDVSVEEALSLLTLLGETAQKFDPEWMLHTGKIDSESKRNHDIRQQVSISETVLILGSGVSVERHKAAIAAYVSQTNITVFSLNLPPSDLENMVDFCVACEPLRFMSDVLRYGRSGLKVIVPKAYMRKFFDVGEKSHILDYEMCLTPNYFLNDTRGCSLPSPLALGYALALANSLGAKQIFLAGIDGFGSQDSRNAELERLFDSYFADPERVKPVSVTETSFNLLVKSIYQLV